MSENRCQCGRFAYCIPKLCLNGVKIKQRGTEDRRIGRFGELQNSEYQSGRTVQTQVKEVQARSIISVNQSPDIPWSKTINPYQGCEHGCVYCYARPSHAYHGLSPALDFETQLFAKLNAPELLRDTLSKRNYVPTTLGIGTNTDCYQPIERRFEITRKLLEVCLEFRHPVSVLTKNSLIERDIDLLTELAKKKLLEVHFSVTTLDHHLARQLEPRASLPKKRLATIEKLSSANIPVKAMMSPLIPGVNQQELKAVMKSVKLAGASSIGYILLRLPYEVEGLFGDWLERYCPDNKAEIITKVAAMRQKESEKSYFDTRMQGSGPVAESIARDFNRLFSQLAFTPMSPDDLDVSQFTRRFGAVQRELF